jgi:hypothetical protein
MSEEIRERLRWLISHMNDPRMDGFNQFGAKQELYEIKWIVDKALDDAPTFSIEKDWLEERINAMTLL